MPVQSIVRISFPSGFRTEMGENPATICDKMFSSFYILSNANVSLHTNPLIFPSILYHDPGANPII